MTNLTELNHQCAIWWRNHELRRSHPMPDTDAVQERIAHAQAELAEAQAELNRIKALPKLDRDSLYLIQEPNWAYVAYGRDLSYNELNHLTATRFVTVGSIKDGNIKQRATQPLYVGNPVSFLKRTTVVRLHMGDL